MSIAIIWLFFFFNDTATTEIYTLSLHDALPISFALTQLLVIFTIQSLGLGPSSAIHSPRSERDRKSTRLNSSHGYISYAVFCLKKKNCLAHHDLRTARLQPRSLRPAHFQASCSG